jgi:hypothetical protein
MDHNPQNQHGNIPHPSADFGSVPNNSESFGSVRNATEEFRSIPQISERKNSHTLTVREVARMFEAAGVARTERSIVNWCQPNRTGIARLDSYFDPNERRYYISPQSVDSAIAEEKAKATKHKDVSEPFGTVPPAGEAVRKTKPSTDGNESRVTELERENLDLKITNRAKDIELERMDKERKSFFDQLLSANQKIGELGNKLLQIESPKPDV